HVDAVQELLEQQAKIEAKESSRDETAMHFAAANGRAAVLRFLTSRGASVSATTKVVDLSIHNQEQEEFGAPAPRNTANNSSGVAPSGVAPQPERRRGSANQVGGVERRFFYTELVGTQGGLTPLLFAARQGATDAVQALL